MRARLDGLLNEEEEGQTTTFVWLRQFEPGKNSADINRLLDRLEFLKAIALAPEIMDDIPAHRVTRLRRQGNQSVSGRWDDGQHTLPHSLLDFPDCYECSAWATKFGRNPCEPL